MADKYSLSARVLVNGKKVREYSHEGRIFIQSNNGTEFEIDLKNHYGNRVMAVVSVDGVDVINGKPATSESAGYIIGGNDAIRIKGFRKDSDTVGAFKFTEKENSYASGTGEGGNEGVIAIRFFEEKRIERELLWESYDNYIAYTGSSVGAGPLFSSNVSNYSQTLSSDTLGQKRGILRSCASGDTQTYSAEVKSENFDMGTTWGSKKKDSAVEVEFERGKLLDEFNLFYASRDALIGMGVPLTKENHISLPQGFRDFATPPSNWEG